MQQQRTLPYLYGLTVALAIVALLLTATQASAQTELRINAGGDIPVDFVDSNGDLFVADKAFVAGDFGFVGGAAHGPIPGIADPYARLRADPAFSYVFDALPVGDYDITLYFAEATASGSVGTFDVTVEGQLFLDDLIVLDRAGANRVPYQESLTVTVTDGTLEIDFSASSGLAHVAAIAVIR